MDIFMNLRKYTLFVFAFIAFSVTVLRGQECSISNAVDITVVSDPSMIISGATTICSGGNATLNANITNPGAGICRFLWQQSPTGIVWIDIPSSNSGTYVTPALLQTTHYRLLRICDGIGCDTAFSNNQLVTVVPDPSVTVQPISFSECIGGNLFFNSTATGGTPTLLYQWQSSTNGTSGWTDISGATTTNYTPLSITDAITYYRIIVSATGNGCGQDTSAIVTATVVKDPVVSIVANDSLICTTETVNFNTTVTGGTGAATYQWQISTDSLAWTDISGATSATYTTTPLLATRYFRVIVKQGNGCETASSGIKIVVDPCNASLGNYVWEDLNANGIQESGEPGIQGVLVTLTGTTIDGVLVTLTMLTDATGFYLFQNLTPGNYVVTFTRPAGYEPTIRDIGGNGLDSDADLVTGTTPSVSLASGEQNLTIDAGYYRQKPKILRGSFP